MEEYRVAYIKSIVEEEIVEASSFDEAKAKWEAKGIDGDLYFIINQKGDQVILYG